MHEVVDTQWLPREGEVVAGHYRVGRCLGAGGMGAVVSAVHVGHGQPLALKFLHPRLLGQKENVARFVREARAALRIRSEHVVKVLDIGGTETGLPFIAMELLEGDDLAAMVERGAFDVTLAVDCILQAGTALAEAHRAGIIHRDVKPSNLWLSRRPDGRPLVKVLDFGISKLADAPDGTRGGIITTDTTAVFGSPMYMSPEQVRSSKNVTAAADVWALGVVLFELLAGRPPFTGETAAAVLAAVMADEPPPLDRLRREVPTEIARLVERCLTKSVDRRVTLDELLDGLAPFGSDGGALRRQHIALDRTEPYSVPTGSHQSFATTLMAAPAAGRARVRARFLAAPLALLVLLAGAFALRSTTARHVLVATKTATSSSTSGAPLAAAEPEKPPEPTASSLPPALPAPPAPPAAAASSKKEAVKKSPRPRPPPSPAATAPALPMATERR